VPQAAAAGLIYVSATGLSANPLAISATAPPAPTAFATCSGQILLQFQL